MCLATRPTIEGSAASCERSRDTNQAAIIALCRVVNRYVGNLPPMPGYSLTIRRRWVRATLADRELAMMRWGMSPPPRAGGYPVTNEHVVAALAGMPEAREP
jgi:hypothetical protein